MNKVVWSGVVTAAAVLCFSVPSFAQTTGSIGVSASVNAKAKLTIGAPSITFADADPDTDLTISASAVTIAVKARTSAGGTVSLTVLATQDLTSGSDIIPISALKWTVDGTAGFAAGTSNVTTAQTVASWSGSANRTGAQTYVLDNSWAYATGTYVTTLNYTLSVP
jgi:hypothetical protein